MYIFLRKCCEVFVCVSNLLCASLGSGKDIRWQVSGFKNQKYESINRKLEIFTFCWKFCNKTMILLWECCVTVQNTNKQRKKKKKTRKKYNLWTICCFIDLHVNYLSMILFCSFLFFFLFCCNCCKGFKYLWSSLYGDNVILVTCWVL